MMDQKTRIFLVDDHPLVREWLTILLRQEPDFVVCGEASSSEQALQRIGAATPDLAIVDLSLGDQAGLELIRTLKGLYPKLLVVVLSMHDERTYAARALRAGARGYVEKREATNVIVTRIRQVLEGKLGVSENISGMLSEMFVHGSAPDQKPIETLSDRELEIFRLLGQGRDTRAISVSLNISIKTVQTYCARIREKLNIRSGAELLREAIQWQTTESG